jgi:hypothetical protein
VFKTEVVGHAWLLEDWGGMKPHGARLASTEQDVVLWDEEAKGKNFGSVEGCNF